jgi:methionyl-tRNA formyltransferase
MRISLLSTEDSPILGYVIEAFLRHDVPIHSVILDPEKYSEKNRRIFLERTGDQMPQMDLAKFKRNLSFVSVPSHSSDECIALVKKEKIDALVNAGTPRILPQKILDAASLGVLNCHPGLLPEYRGCSCVEWALWNGDPVGNTIHLMTEDIDRGPILAKEAITINDDDSYQDIRVKAYLGGFDLLARTIKQLLDGDLTERDFIPGEEGAYHKPMPDDVFQQLKAKFQ